MGGGNDYPSHLPPPPPGSTQSSSWMPSMPTMSSSSLFSGGAGNSSDNSMTSRGLASQSHGMQGFGNPAFNEPPKSEKTWMQVLHFLRLMNIDF